MTLRPGHLGTRTSALLDGQLPAAEAERAWQHVRECPACSAEVEREAWLKRRLACLSDPRTAAPAAPSGLKSELLGAAARAGAAPVPVAHRSRRAVGLVAFGGGAVGAAFMGVLTVGAAPAAAPDFQRTTPVTAVNTTVSGSVVVHVRQHRP